MEYGCIRKRNIPLSSEQRPQHHDVPGDGKPRSIDFLPQCTLLLYLTNTPLLLFSCHKAGWYHLGKLHLTKKPLGLKLLLFSDLSLILPGKRQALN